ncbi:MAG: efflux transporter outer membrane subunit [Deltaproteobacteria bacterium]|nr:efflux transporter outer membrane subunit [Deltaproteobacteria bacterium]
MNRSARALATALILGIGCAVGPNFERPAAPTQQQYVQHQAAATSSADSLVQRFETDAGVPTNWWALYGSPQLDAVMNDALANNANLAAAQASLRRSQDLLRAGYGVFFPQLDGNGSAERRRFSGQQFGINTTSVFNLFTLQSTVSYALDVWGGERRQVEALQAQADVQRYTLAGTYLSLTGNIVNTIVARAAYRAQIRATEELVKLEAEQVDITTAQAEAGTTPWVNLLAIKSQLAALQATLPPLRQKYDQADHLLAVLAGHTPADWTAPDVELANLRLALDLPATVPSELVRQRPDILTAEAGLHQASAEIGVATAALLPSFTLSANAGLNSKNISDLFMGSSGFWAFGGGLTAPLFRGGTLWYERKAAIEAHNQAIEQYRQTVLGAFQQVADALQGLGNDAELVQAQSDQLAASGEQLHLIQLNYQAGTANYLQVLLADGQYHQAVIGHLQAQAQRLQDTAALYLALGGGWQGNEARVEGKPQAAKP